MRVTALPDLLPSGGRRKVAIGTFDGLHVGHRELIRGNDTVLTFDPHPAQVVRPDKAPRLLYPFSIKRDLIAELGVHELVVIPFDREFSRKDAEDFVTEVLIERLNAEVVSVGDNFHFGKGARGTPDFLRGYTAFATREVPLVHVIGEPASSTRIRSLIEAGNVTTASQLLGGPFLLEGNVARCEPRGSGIATAGLSLADGYVQPADGVYAAWSHGRPATVDIRSTRDPAQARLVEAHLAGHDGDLYDRPLRLALLERLREGRRFAHSDESVQQVRQDLERTRHIFTKAQVAWRRVGGIASVDVL